MKKSLRQHRRRFTLIELLVVIVIIGMLMALLLPALSKAKYRAKVVVCMNNLKEISTGVQSYASDYDMYYPSVGDWPKQGNLVIGRLNSWTFDGGPARHYLLELLDSEFGGDCLKNVFTCPLAVKGPEKNSSISSAWNYSLWPDTTGRGAIRFESTAYGHDRDRRKMMMKVGDSFNVAVNTNGSNTRKDCRALVMDRSYQGLISRDKFGTGRTLGTNHFPPGFTRYTTTANDWRMLYWGISGGEMNIAMDDGSVFAKRLDNLVSTNAQYKNFYVTLGQYEATYLPVDSFEE